MDKVKKQNKKSNSKFLKSVKPMDFPEGIFICGRVETHHAEGFRHAFRNPFLRPIRVMQPQWFGTVPGLPAGPGRSVAGCAGGLQPRGRSARPGKGGDKAAYFPEFNVSMVHEQNN